MLAKLIKHSSFNCFVIPNRNSTANKYDIPSDLKEIFCSDDNLLISAFSLDKKPPVYKKSKEKKATTSSLADQKELTDLHVDIQFSKEQEKTRQENRHKLEEERRIEKKNAFERCLKLIRKKEVFFDREFLYEMNQMPLVSDDIFERENRNKLYDEKELELASKHLIRAAESRQQSDFYYPSVTKIISIADQSGYERLLKWKLDTCDRLGFDGFQLQSKEMKDKGNLFHKSVESFLKKEDLPEINKQFEMEKSIDNVKKLIQSEFHNKYELIESKVVHTKLAYEGRFDCLAYYNNELCLIDWKWTTQPKQRDDLFMYPVQLAAYTGAYLNDPSLKEFRKKHRLTKALVVNISQDGDVNIHEFNYHQLQFYWYRWVNLSRDFWYMVLQHEKESLKKNRF